jgi:hypothetical protein
MYNNTLISSLSNASFQTQHKTTSKAKCSIAHTERAKQTLKWQWMNQCRTLAASPVYHQFALSSEISGHRRWGLIRPQCSCSLVLQKSIPQLLLSIFFFCVKRIKHDTYDFTICILRYLNYVWKKNILWFYDLFLQSEFILYFSCRVKNIFLTTLTYIIKYNFFCVKGIKDDTLDHET